MDANTQIQIVTILCSTFLAALTLWLRYDVNGLKPHVLSVREELEQVKVQLADANKFIFSQDAKMTTLRDENAGLAATQSPIRNQTRWLPPDKK